MAKLFRRGAIVSVRQLMCTVSFLPRPNGFYLAMNRDEKRTRSSALPPAIVDLATGRVRPTGGLTKRRAIFPREPNGGTWISTNDAGVCLALINWHRIDRDPMQGIISRGEVVEALAGKSSTDEIAAGLTALPLRQLRPFRLIAIISAARSIDEWRWNLETLSVRKHKWGARHWFSSGFDERRAESERTKFCDAADQQRSAGTLAWLRRLHRSHSPKRGPFSICMHRADATTVSYTEVVVSGERITMRYKAGSPCSEKSTITSTLFCL
jgi:hypothetical protein